MQYRTYEIMHLSPRRQRFVNEPSISEMIYRKYSSPIQRPKVKPLLLPSTLLPLSLYLPHERMDMAKLLTDAYDLFYISLVTKLLGRIYYTVPASPTPSSLPSNVSAAVNGVAFIGTLSGQLLFGWLSDKMGRNASTT